MKQSNKWKNILPGLSLYSLVLIRYLYYGFHYFYQLDDYIQYANMPFFNPDRWKMIGELGLLSSRPLAGISDAYVWSRFFSIMILAVALIAALYTASGLLLRRVFRCHFQVGGAFLVLFALLPLGFEGTYWVSASSRIVCGLFFVSLGAWLLQRFMDGHRYCLAAALLLQFVGSCFYEQVLVFSVALYVLLGILNFRRCGKRALWGGFSVINTGLYFFLTSLAPAGGFYSGRMEIALPLNRYYYQVFLPDILRQIKNVFWNGNLQTVFRGFVRGLKLIVQDRAVWFALILIALCSIFAVAMLRCTPQRNEKSAFWKALIVGLLLALAPLAPFFLIANPFFSFRGAVVSFAGLALMGDVLLGALWNRLHCGRMVQACFAGCLALLFCVAGVAELHDYRQTMLDDRQAAEVITAQIDLSDPNERIGLLGMEPSFLKEQSFYWHEHIHGVTESDWALAGLLQFYTKKTVLPAVVPLPADQLYLNWNYESNRLDRFDRLYYFDFSNRKVIPLRWEQTGERTFALYTEDGAAFGTVADQDGRGFFTAA